MVLPFGITVGEITVVGFLAVAVPLGVSKLWDWWQYRVEARRERVYEWHREMQDLFSKVIIVGMHMETNQRTGVDLGDVAELVPIASALDARVTTPPQGVLGMVQRDVFEDVRRAAGLTYHLVRLPTPDQDADSIAGVMRHQYRLLQELEVDTDVAMRNVVEVIGEIRLPEEVDVSDGEVERILAKFEEEADRRMVDAEEMTVDELMKLPWNEIDRVLSTEGRRELVQFIVEQYFEKVLLEIPRQARSSLRQSQDDLFE